MEIASNIASIVSRHLRTKGSLLLLTLCSRGLASCAAMADKRALRKSMNS